MDTIDAFTFSFGDAWYSDNWGYRAILETGLRKQTINWIIDGEVFFLDITGRIRNFIQFLEDCNVMSWDNKRYIKYQEDGYLWDLNISYNGKTTLCSGINGYPVNFDKFMIGLHKDWNLPAAIIDGQKGFSWKRRMEGTIIEKLQ